MDKGKFFIISSPSGVGKSSLIKEVVKNMKILITTSISHTTRSARPGEKNGKHYYFISKNKFKKMIHNNEFLEYAKVFNHYYGTSRDIIKEIFSTGKDVLLDIDWQGARQIKKHTSQYCSVFLLPPSYLELNRRLHYRNQDTKNIIMQRMKQCVFDMQHYKEYDYLIINDNFNTALLELITIIQAEKLKIKYQMIANKVLIKKLLSN